MAIPHATVVRDARVHTALLAVARDWVNSASARPADDAIGLVELRRATSNAYYALFHAIAAEAADLLAGPGSPHWARVYRSPDHKRCKDECLKAARPNSGHSEPIKACANSFASLQAERHKADYDPLWRTNPLDVATQIDAAERAISDLKASPEPERRAFVLCLLFPQRP